MAASELASAVADMLNAAGMPVDLDKQELLHRALAADQQLSAANAAVAELRQAAQQKEAEVDALRNAWQCRVCFSKDVDRAFVGCGHMYCGSCMPSLARCPVCRTTSAKIKLYK
jgi:sacsin